MEDHKIKHVIQKTIKEFKFKSTFFLNVNLKNALGQTQISFNFRCKTRTRYLRKAN